MEAVAGTSSRQDLPAHRTDCRFQALWTRERVDRDSYAYGGSDS